MNLATPVIVLVVGLIAAFAIICGLGAVILTQRKGHDMVTAIIAGFAAGAAGLIAACTLLGAIAAMA